MAVWSGTPGSSDRLSTQDSDFTVQAQTDPTSITITVTNSLLNTIAINVNGVSVGTVPASETRQETLPYTSSLAVDWDLVRTETTLGIPVGDIIGGIFPTKTDPPTQVDFTVDAVIGDDAIFTPMVTSNSSSTLLMSVNHGLQAENRCNCTVPAFSTGTRLGYYDLFSNSNVRGYHDGSGYTGAFIFWDNFTASVDQTTGLVNLTATSGPAVSLTLDGTAELTEIEPTPPELPLFGIRVAWPTELPSGGDSAKVR